MKIALWVAGIAIVGGLGVLAAYWIVYVFAALFGADEIPVLVKIAVPTVAVGAAVLLVVAVVQRMRDRKEEDFKEVEY